MSFAHLGLCEAILRAITELGHKVPTPIQEKAVPLVLAGRDLLGAAQTGTGKTAAFALPMLERLKTRGPAGIGPRALVLTPTRELAMQVAASITDYGRHMPLRTVVVYGGVGIHKQFLALRRGVDVLVATPGRLLDHIEQRSVKLSNVEMLVLDEADRMLDMGFMPAIRRIIDLLPKSRQNLLFSATFSSEVRKFAASLLHNPETVEVAPRNAAATNVEQCVHLVDKDNKRSLLLHLLRKGDWERTLVFARTKHGAERLADQLCGEGILATAIHGNKSQGARTKALTQFKQGHVRVLVATDVAARGLDVDGVSHVVNFDLPNTPEDYVHRIGRTGRAGASGEAVSLVSGDERQQLKDIQGLLGRTLPQSIVEGFKPSERASADSTARPASSARRRHGQGQKHQQHQPGHRREDARGARAAGWKPLRTKR